MRSEKSDIVLTEQKLEHDIKNAFNHVLEEQAWSIDIEASEDNQCSYWTDGAHSAAQEQSRLATTGRCETDTNLIRTISDILIIGTFYNELTELWVKITAKFDVGTFCNRCNREP